MRPYYRGGKVTFEKTYTQERKRKRQGAAKGETRRLPRLQTVGNMKGPAVGRLFKSTGLD